MINIVEDSIRIKPPIINKTSKTFMLKPVKLEHMFLGAIPL